MKTLKEAVNREEQIDAVNANVRKPREVVATASVAHKAAMDEVEKFDDHAKEVCKEKEKEVKKVELPEKKPDEGAKYNLDESLFEEVEVEKEVINESKKLDESVNGLVTVKLPEDILLNMLMDRLDTWTTDKEVTDLYEQMYESYLDNDVFEDAEFDPMVIVDNDWVNYCEVISKGEDRYDEVKKAYDDYEREVEGVGYIEAADGDGETFLVRVN